MCILTTNEITHNTTPVSSTTDTHTYALAPYQAGTCCSYFNKSTKSVLAQSAPKPRSIVHCRFAARGRFLSLEQSLSIYLHPLRFYCTEFLATPLLLKRTKTARRSTIAFHLDCRVFRYKYAAPAFFAPLPLTGLSHKMSGTSGSFALPVFPGHRFHPTLP